MLFTVEHLNFENVAMNYDDSTPELIQIVENNTLLITVKNLTGLVQANYNYISKPKILADIGYFVFELLPVDFELGI